MGQEISSCCGGNRKSEKKRQKIEMPLTKPDIDYKFIGNDTESAQELYPNIKKFNVSDEVGMI